MRKRAFWLVSLVFVGAALCFHAGALSNASAGAGNVARAVSVPESESQQLKAEAKRLASTSNSLAFTGIIAAVSAVACLFVSIRRHEPARQSVLVALLAFYLLLQFVMV